MKQILLSLLCFLFLNGSSFAQDDPLKWGDIDKEDLGMKVYPQDSSAAAVVLADYGVAYFTFDSDKGFQLNLDRHTRIKILKTNGLDKANQQIALYHSGTHKEEVFGLKGITYNLEGGKIQKDKMSKKEVFNEAYDENRNLVKFTLPNVKEGSVIEFKYTLRSDFIYNFITWKFQRDIPVQWSEFRARVPEYYHYKHFMRSYIPVSLAESAPYQDSFNYTYKEENKVRGGAFNGGGQTRSTITSGTVRPSGMAYRWVMEGVPALKEEAYITTIEDYFSRIEFELSYTKYPGQTMNTYSNSWEKLSEEFLKDSRFGGELGRARYLQDVVSAMQKEASDMELLNKIVRYVQENFHYNGKERVYTQEGLKKVFDKKEGNSAEINLLLTLMLREAGFQANPVILSTRSHGMVNPVIPLEKDFNYVLAHVKMGEQEILLDGTDPALPVGMLPYKCLNQQGRIISEGYTGWVPLLSQEVIKKASQADLSLAADGSVSGQLVLKHGGYPAVWGREKLQEKGEEKYKEEAYGEKGWNILTFAVEDPETTSSELVENISMEIPNAVTVAGDRIYFQPMLTDKESESPFKLENRSFPVDFGCPMETLSVTKIKLPQGYEVEELPEQLLLSLPDKSGTFRFMVTQVGNELSVLNILKFNKPIYLPEEYAALKQFYEMVLAKQAEQVVLRQITE